MFDLDKIAIETITEIEHHLQWKFLQELYFGGAEVQPHIPTMPVEQSPIREQIALLVRCANGWMREDARRSEVAETIQSLCETLFSNALFGSYEIPSQFWQTDLGKAIQHCQTWLHGEDLITLSEAAQIIRGGAGEADLISINGYIKRGTLRTFIDPDEPNPQRATRVLRGEAEAIRNAKLKGVSNA